MKDLEKLEQLEQQAKALEGIDPAIMDEKQITQLAEQLELMFNDSETLIKMLSEELKQEQENDKDK